jgi:PadR family transcriptional regulator PadR
MLASQLRKGSAELLILGVLHERSRHGYDIARIIEERSEGTISFRSATLYPTLYRLEQTQLITGRWVERAGQRRRRFYRITAAGRAVLGEHRSAWTRFFDALDPDYADLASASVFDGAAARTAGGGSLRVGDRTCSAWSARPIKRSAKTPSCDSPI